MKPLFMASVMQLATLISKFNNHIYSAAVHCKNDASRITLQTSAAAFLTIKT